MSAARTAVLVLLLCVCVSAVVVVGASTTDGQPTQTDTSSMQPVADANTTEYLAIPPSEIERDEFERGKLDVAAAVSGDVGAVKSRYVSAQLERSTQEAETEADRREAVARAVRRAERRVDALETRERQAVTEYSDGTRDGPSFVRALLAVDTEAAALDEMLITVYEHNERLDEPATTLETLAELRTRLISLQGPVRDHLGGGTGDGAERVYVETSGDDIAMSTISDGQYVREAHYRDGRDRDGVDELGFSGADRRYEELYPWTFNNSGPTSIGTIAGQPFYHHAGVYDISIGHSHGSGSTTDLVTYIDGSTTEVFTEHQRKDPELVPTEDLHAENDDGSLRLHVETTRAGGPLGVSVVDNATDEPVDAEVTMNDEPLGSTTDDRLWTVAPRGEVRINATHAGETLTVETRFD